MELHQGPHHGLVPLPPRGQRADRGDGGPGVTRGPHPGGGGRPATEGLHERLTSYYMY